MAGAVTITGGSSGRAGERALPTFMIPGQVDIDVTTSVMLSTGDNTIAVPTGSVGVVVIPPANNPTYTWLLRTNLNSSDAGLPILSVSASLFVFPNLPPSTSPGPSSLILHASAATVSPIDFWFW